MHPRYAAKRVAFLTQHGKESLIGPLLATALGCEILRTEGYDTDLLGSFSGEVKRTDSQLKTAKRKARIGMRLSGLTIGLGSEGAFVPDPYGGLMPWNIEVLTWLDDDHGLEIVGMAQGPARSMHRSIRNEAELEDFAQAAGFPEHHLLLRPQSESDLRIQKGLSNWTALKQAFAQCLRASDNARVFAENDLRAFCNPTRQWMIRRAAEDLLKKIQSACPVCDLPGFCKVSHTPGLPCGVCRCPTPLAKAFQWQCAACAFTQVVSAIEPHADASRCNVCNP
jgi:hypothetical protein